MLVAFQDEDVETKWYRIGMVAFAIICVCLFLILAFAFGMVEDRDVNIDELKRENDDLINQLWESEQLVNELRLIIEEQRRLLEQS